MTSMAASCPLCGGAATEIVYDLSVATCAEDVPGWVVRCGACAMWFKQLVDPGGIPKAYAGEHGQDAVAEAYLMSDAARSLFRDSLAEVTRQASPGSRLRLLDIGAGQGVLLEEAARLGFAAEGIDHCEPNVQDAHAKGLSMRLLAAEDLVDQDQFDVVTMMDLIEHVPDPMRLLVNAYRALKPGGELVVYTPNHRGAVVVLAKLLHRFGLHYPVREIFGRNHVCFFDDRSLAQALGKAGFEVRGLRQFPYDPARPGQYVSPLNLAAVTLVERLGQPFQRVFRMLAYARKPAAAAQGST